MVAKRLPSAQGPYFGLIARIVDEFETLDPQNAPPEWAGLAFQYRDLQQEAKAAGAVDPKESDLLKKATATVKSKIAKAEKKFGVKARLPLSAEAHINAVKSVSAYQGALDSMVKAADSRNVAFAMAADLYQQDPVTGESPFFVASRNVDTLKSLMSERPNESETLFWDLIDANERFMQRFIVREAACHLQSLWEKQVLLEIEDVSADRDMAQLIMGPDGFGTQFIKGPAEPFVGRSLNKGFFPKRVMGMEIPLQQEFLNYLSKGAQAARPPKSSYTIKIRAYPTDTNRGAQLQPHSTVLEVQCGDGNARLENLNYPVAKAFAWSPSTCGDVTFQISVGNLVLSKSYTGNLAFAKFLHEFKTGQRIFNRNEFPSDEAALQRMGIEYIKAKYQFEGQEEVLSLLYSTPGAPPRKIASCWD
jgi:type VI secretion system protein ImpL